MMNQNIEGFIDSGDVKIHYIGKQFNSSNAATILFVPGIMMPAEIWRKQLEYFSEKYNVAAMEPRSQGDSEQTCEGHYAFSMAKDIQAVVKTLDLKSLVLVGWSIGVPQVINYAAHFDSNRLKGIVLIDGIVGTDPTIPFYQAMVDYWTEFQMNRVPNTEKFIKSLFKKYRNESYFAELNKIAMRTPTNTVMTLINNYILQDFRPLLPLIKIPTLIATIEGPRLGYMLEMQKLLPNSYFEVFDSAGHALFVDKAEKFNRSLEAFIEAL